MGGVVKAVGNAFSSAGKAVGGAVHSAVNAVGGAVDDTGKAVSTAGKDLQNAVDGAGNWVDNHVDNAVDSFEHSSIGNNVVGHALGSAVEDTTHFATGVASGATTLVSGTAELAGGAMQYASNGQFRDNTNKTIGYIATHPGQVADSVWNQGVQAFEKDPAHAAGEIAGIVGSAVLTGGAGLAGDAGEGAGVAGDVADAADAASKVGEAADAANTASKVGDLSDAADGASKAADTATDTSRIAGPEDPGLRNFLNRGNPAADSSIPKDAVQIQKFDDTHYSFVKDGNLYVRSGDNYTVRQGDFLDLKAKSLTEGQTYVRNIRGHDVALYGIKNPNDAETIFKSLQDVPVTDSLENSRSIFVVDHIGHGTTPDWQPNGTYIAGLAGNNQGEIGLSREALSSVDNAKNTLYHEMGHNLDVSRGGGYTYGISKAPESPFGTGTYVSDYAATNAQEDLAETHGFTMKLLQSGLDNKGNAFYYLSRVSDPSLQAKFSAVLRQYGMNIPFLR